MSSKNILTSKIQETESIIQWAISKVPPERILESPPHGKHPQSGKGFKTYFGDWSALRQLFHLAFYEETYAIPSMQHFTGSPHPSVDLVFPEPESEERAWQDALAHDVDVSSLLQRFSELRDFQLHLLSEIPEETLESERVQTGLGPVSAEFVVTKTIQHSLEHANEIMKNALYWERALYWLDMQEIS